MFVALVKCCVIYRRQVPLKRVSFIQRLKFWSTIIFVNNLTLIKDNYNIVTGV